MSHITPKTNWNSESVGDDDFNRIEENIRVQHQGGGIADGDSLTEPLPDSDYELDIGTEHDTFLFNPPELTGFPWDPADPGVIYIHSISTTGRSASNKITLVNINAGTTHLPGFIRLVKNQTPSSGYAGIRYYAANHDVPANGSVSLVYTGNYWYVIG